MRFMSAFMLAALFTTAAAAQPAKPPKLVIAISVDQFSADLFDEYRPRFAGGMARLASGTVYRNGYQGHNATETCPGHSTILTGSRPARTGIIANNWFNLGLARADKVSRARGDQPEPTLITPAGHAREAVPEHRETGGDGHRDEREGRDEEPQTGMGL